MKTIHFVILFVISCSLIAMGLFSEYHKVCKERDFAIKKLERFEARYERGDLDHTIHFKHACGHFELFSLSRDQVYYLMQLQAHPCFDCNHRDDEPTLEEPQL